MAKIYLLPGLGTDKRVFDKLLNYMHVEDVEHLEFIKPLHAKEAVKSYVRRLAKNIDTESGEDIILIGFSLGGVFAVEIAKFIDCKDVILISSVKDDRDTPWTFKLMRKLPLYKLFSARTVKYVLPIISKLTRSTVKEDTDLVQRMINDFDAQTLNWGTETAISWRNEGLPTNILQIHGNRDIIFPHFGMRVDYMLKGGSHGMILSHAADVANLINKRLEFIKVKSLSCTT